MPHELTVSPYLHGPLNVLWGPVSICLS